MLFSPGAPIGGTQYPPATRIKQNFLGILKPKFYQLGYPSNVYGFIRISKAVFPDAKVFLMQHPPISIKRVKPEFQGLAF